MTLLRPLDPVFPIERQLAISAYPSSAVASPHLFQKVAAPGICVA